MRALACILLLVQTLLIGCAAGPWNAQEIRAREATPADRDALTVAHCAERMEQCCGRLQSLRANLKQAEFLQPRDQDLLEHSFAEYLFCRNELAQIAQRQKSQDAELSLVSLRCQAQYDISVAALAVEDPVLGRALNQAFHRSNISRGSCDRIIHELTATPIAILPSDDQARVNEVIRRRALLLPSVENGLWHTQPVQLISASSQVLSAQFSRGQNMLVTATGRLKNPAYTTLTFSEEQRAQIRSALLPGDILLTYTAGYASNLFVPGTFKHAATFIGTEEERSRVGFPQERLLSVAGNRIERLKPALAKPVTEHGEPADAVESIAEGVLLINFDRLLTTRINRLLVLRPRLHDEERAQQFVDVLSYVGDEFDFSFDLTDASDQVCTEVVYRSLQGRGGIELALAKYAGRLTLPPDEILKYAASQRGESQFDCILVVEEAPDSAGTATILHAAEAKPAIARLLGTSQ